MKHIRFDQTKFDSKGRNGFIGTTGINLADVGEELFLEPITTRGINSEACRIVLPKAAITELIEALTGFMKIPGHQSCCAAVRQAGATCDCTGSGEYEEPLLIAIA